MTDILLESVFLYKDLILQCIFSDESDFQCQKNSEF